MGVIVEAAIYIGLIGAGLVTMCTVVALTVLT